MSEFTSFVERPEKVEAFQFVGPHQVEQVLDAFGAPHDQWNLNRSGKTYRLTFPHSRGQKGGAPQYDGGLVFEGTINIVGTAPGQLYYPTESGKYAVVSGSWVTRRYTDTDHPEVTVLSDKEFRRKYRAQIEAR